MPISDPVRRKLVFVSWEILDSVSALSVEHLLYLLHVPQDLFHPNPPFISLFIQQKYKHVPVHTLLTVDVGFNVVLWLRYSPPTPVYDP